MNISTAGAADIPVIQELAYKIWPGTYQAILGPEQVEYMLDLLYSVKTLREQMEQQVDFIIVSDNDNPVGFASFSSTHPDVYKLHKIYVLPSQQGKGTGRMMIDYVKKEAASAGAKFLQLNVNRHNNAKHFYEKLGFVVIREEDIDIGNGYFMNDYVMQVKLDD